MTTQPETPPGDETERKYFDSEGRECSLDTLCRREPGWAASRLRVMRAELDEARQWNREMVDKAASGGVLDGYREMGARIAELESELATIKAQAGDSTEYVLAQVNRELLEEVEMTHQGFGENAMHWKRANDELKERIADLEGVIRDAPHGRACEPYLLFSDGDEPCDCWKSEALPNDG